MKILAIRGKNLASIEGEFEIDFTRPPLLESGIFAITGHTGSGKSTILDALCLALYEKTPRSQRAKENGVQIKDARSFSISQDDVRGLLRRGTADGYAEVDFVSLGGEQFRARWSVRRSRNRVDGKLQSTDLQLHNLTTKSEEQGRKTELYAKITDLIGLTFEQFTRAVLLAQGDFASFLKAKQSEKAELLEKITGTDIYSRISIEIYQRYKDAEQNLKTVKDKIDNVELLDEESIIQLTSDKKELGNSLQLSIQELEILTAKIKWIGENENLIKEVSLANEQTERAKKDIADAENRYAYMAQIDLVQDVSEVYHKSKNIKKHLSTAQKDSDEAKKQQVENEQQLSKYSSALQGLKLAEDQLNDNWQQIEPQLQKARELDTRMEEVVKAVKSAKQEFVNVQKYLTKTESSIGQTENTIATNDSRTQELEQWFSESQRYVGVIPEIGRISTIIDSITTVKEQIKKQTLTLDSEKKKSSAQNKKLLSLQQKFDRLNAMLPTEVITLRQQLKADEACPVCGSMQHNVPPLDSIEGLQQQELERAKTLAEQALLELRESLTKNETTTQTIISHIESLYENIKSYTINLELLLKEYPNWESEMEDNSLKNNLQQLHKQWGDNSNELLVSREKLLHLKENLKKELEDVDVIKQDTNSKEKLFTAQKDLLETLEKERKTLLAGLSCDKVQQEFTARKSELTTKLRTEEKRKEQLLIEVSKTSGKLAQLQVDIEKYRTQKVDLLNIIQEWCANHDIKLEVLDQIFALDADWLKREREALQYIREQLSSTQATLKERISKQTSHQEADVRPSLEETLVGLNDRDETVKLEIKDSQNRLTEIEVRFIQHKKAKEKIQEFEEELKNKEQIFENWNKLNSFLGSASGSTFKTIAQGYTLDTLLLYANKQLDELTKRYKLQRVADSLALEVIDLDMLGEVRSVHSLSGGESFLVSLALALGLSSLSSNRMKVESLFIDEGFGSLDIDTLRVAMDALERLQTQGRKIGVISHVEEMTAGISSKILITKTANGRSKVEVVGK